MKSEHYLVEEDEELTILNPVEIETRTPTSAEGRNVWTFNESLALIAAVEMRYEDMFHITKKKTFWKIVSEELNNQNIPVSELACQRKWNNLMRTYKNCKEKKNKTGKGPSKFILFERLDTLLGDSPNNKSFHTVYVSSCNVQDFIENEGDPITDQTTSREVGTARNSPTTSEEIKREKPLELPTKRKNPTHDYYKKKANYYEKKLKRAERRERREERFLELKEQEIQLEQEKVRLEKRKIELLEKINLN